MPYGLHEYLHVYSVQKIMQAAWATLTTRLSPATLPVMPTLPPLMLGLALFSVTTLYNSVLA